MVASKPGVNAGPKRFAESLVNEADGTYVKVRFRDGNAHMGSRPSLGDRPGAAMDIAANHAGCIWFSQPLTSSIRASRIFCGATRPGCLNGISS